MKKLKWLPLLLAAALLTTSLTACKKAAPAPDPEPSASSQPAEESSQPDATTPDGALNKMLRHAKEWDTESIQGYLPEGKSLEQYLSPQMEGLAKSMLNRLDFQCSDVTVDGDHATVNLEITAVDLSAAATELAGAMAGYVAKQQLSGQAVDDDPTAMLVEAFKTIQVDQLPTVTQETTAYMVLGGDGEWKLESGDQNKPMLNAVTGGAVELMDSMKAMAEQYGIDLSTLQQ